MSIHDERVKLSATYLNGIAVAAFAVGAFGPVVTFMSGSDQTIWHVGVVLIFALASLAASLLLHLGARGALEELTDE